MTLLTCRNYRSGDQSSVHWESGTRGWGRGWVWPGEGRSCSAWWLWQRGQEHLQVRKVS